jgi:hypothetical protein
MDQSFVVYQVEMRMRKIKFGLGNLRSLMKTSRYWIKENNVIFKNLDDIIKNSNTLVLKYGKEYRKNRLAVSQPVMMSLENPLFRFPCMPEMKRLVAKSVAESIYAVSGMNGGDFIWEFRGWIDPREMMHYDPESIGRPLRFWHMTADKILDYPYSNYLRQQGVGFTDQLQAAASHFSRLDDDFVISMREPSKNGGTAHSVCFQKDVSGRLQAMVACGEIEVTEELPAKIISSFAFIHQILSEIVNIPPGTLTFAIAKLYGNSRDIKRIKELSKAETPQINGLDNFTYPASNLTLRDMDNLIAIMQEFTGRLDEKSITRANPYAGDSRVQLWADMAEVFRANKAKETGGKNGCEFVFVHPQLRYIYQGLAG